MNNIFQLTSVKEICWCIFNTRSNMTEKELLERIEIFKTQIPRRAEKGKTIDITLLPKELEMIDRIYQYSKEYGLIEKFHEQKLSFDNVLSQIENFIADPEKAYEVMQEPEIISEQNEEETTKEPEIRQDLYSPLFLCGHDRENKEKPFVKLVRSKPDNVVDHQYQFADKSYIIRKIGELVYMPTPAMEDSVSQYEIIIGKEDKTKKIKRFGDISFNKMSESNYNALAFLQLLNIPNLTDESLHGYLGGLEQEIDEQGNLKDSYKLVHSKEAYTAVIIWEELEKSRKEKESYKLKEVGERDE